ncbi:hypothetical protein LJE86_14350 [bacterium BMS3Abin03]|jgi:hypothetical protein|nr:hypothetical protein [bacterium BMS3Abin03]MCG6961250.1 hypothetical protein [bacterium BMS3Abin03]
MSTYYLRVEDKYHIRKVLIDMSYLAKHKIIRLPKYYYEEGLYLPYSDKRDNDGSIKKYALTKDKIFKEDDNFLYFKFPFKHDQVVKTAV